MKFNIGSIQTKIKAFLRCAYWNEIFFLSKRVSIRILKIFLEDIESFDNELYCLFLKKPEKLIILFEFTVKTLFEKIQSKINHRFKFENFQLMFLRKFFYTIPKKIISIVQGELISIKVVILSAAPVKLKTIKNENENPDNYQRNINNLNFLSQDNSNFLTKDKDSALNWFKNSCLFYDYQTVMAKGVFDQELNQFEDTEFLLILEKIMVGKLFPGDELFLTGIFLNFQINQNNYNKQKKFKDKNTCYTIKVIGFSKLSFTPKFQSVGLHDNLDKKFIKFAHSKNIYKWINSLIIPNIQEFTDFKTALACMLFGGNEKILTNGYFFNGQINILILGKNSQLFSNTYEYLKILGSSFKKKKIIENKEHNNDTNNGKVITREIFSSELTWISQNFGIDLIEKLENLNFNDQKKLGDVLETTSYFEKKNLFLSNNDIISTLAFFDGCFKKNSYESKNFTSESSLLIENINKFDFVFTFPEFIVSIDFKKNLNNNYISNFTLNSNLDSIFTRLNKVNFEFLRNYIIFVRRKYRPILSKKASVFIKSAYVFLKISNKKNLKNLFVKNRLSKLESMIKVSESIAKIRMSNKVDSTDALEAIRLVQDLSN